MYELCDQQRIPYAYVSISVVCAYAHVCVHLKHRTCGLMNTPRSSRHSCARKHTHFVQNVVRKHRADFRAEGDTRVSELTQCVSTQFLQHI